MADVRWIGNADKTAQVISGAIATLDATPADNTFTVTIGGVAISVAGITSVGATAAALVALLNASTHPYFSGITWANPSGGTITGTADVPGIPYTATLTKTGTGAGTVTAFSTTTANSSPHDLAVVTNYSGGALPVNGDRLFIESNAVILWNLEAISGVTLAELHIPALTGLIGLNETQFVTDIADGVETPSDETKPEYRPTKLKVGATKAFVGRNDGTSVAAGPGRLNLDFSSIQNTLTVYNTAATAIDTGRFPLRVVGTHADNVGYFYGGKCAYAGNYLTEAATLKTGYVGPNASLYLGPAVSWTTLRNNNGVVYINCVNTGTGNYSQDGENALAFINTSSGTMTTMSSKRGGTITCNGVMDTTNLSIGGGTIVYNSEGTISNVYIDDNGLLNFLESRTTRTVVGLGLFHGRVRFDPAVIDMGGFAISSNGRVELASTPV